MDCVQSAGTVCELRVLRLAQANLRTYRRVNFARGQGEVAVGFAELLLKHRGTLQDTILEAIAAVELQRNVRQPWRLSMGLAHQLKAERYAAPKQRVLLH